MVGRGTTDGGKGLFEVSQLKVLCAVMRQLQDIIFVNGYVNAIGPEKHGEDF